MSKSESLFSPPWQKFDAYRRTYDTNSWVDKIYIDQMVVLAR
ncbi:hypothetical protein [Kangiella sp.]